MAAARTSTVLADHAAVHAGAAAEREHRDDDRDQQRDERGAEQVEDLAQGVGAVVDEDVDQRLAHHQRDGQQDAEHRDAERRADRTAAVRVGVEGVRRRDVDPAPGEPAEERAGDDDGGHRDQHAEGQREAEVRMQVADRGQRAGVRRHQAVHGGEAGQRRDADGDQRDLRAAGDEVDHRHQQDEADLEEHRQPDDRADQGHRPRQGPDGGPAHDRVDDLVGAAGVGEQLGEHRPEGDQDADAGGGGAEAGGERREHAQPVRVGQHVLAGDDADGQGAEDQGDEGVQLPDGDQDDDQRDPGQGREDQLPAGGDRLRELGAREGQQGGQGGHQISLVSVSTYCWTIASTLWSTSIVVPRSSGWSGSRVANWEASSEAGMKWPGTARLAPGDDLGVTLQVQEGDLGRVAAQQVAVAALEGRAADHRARRVAREPRPDGLEPRAAVVVVERLAGGHLRDVRRGVEVVGVGERHPQALRDRGADGRLAGPGHAHDDEKGVRGGGCERGLLCGHEGRLSASGRPDGLSLCGPSHDEVNRHIIARPRAILTVSFCEPRPGERINA